ncbi:unnamed protein product [Rodentolepis nana]|uniref:Phospholipid scramblase n=1 Tax=Rodentolepis nana TaxID=102285 RepID=A0A0R3TAB7_RODNA|nr:unnamed protein product [Rodentolepis nana]
MWVNSAIILNVKSPSKFLQVIGIKSDICTRQFCGRLRSFALHVFNPAGEKLVTIRRDFKCGAVLASCHLCCCCFWHCGRADCGKGCQNFVSNFMQEIFLEAPDGEILGKVKQE